MNAHIETDRPPAAPKAMAGFEHIHRYWDKTNGRYAAKILPGEFYVTRGRAELITTVLGSCVSACVRDPVSGIAGMNHFMLPVEQGSGGGWGDVLSASTRYGNHAMEQLINGILAAGGSRVRLEIKVFGGGRVLTQMTDVGRKNIAFIRQFIRMEGFELAAEDLGDVYPRKIIYFPENGRVRVKKLRSLHNNTILERERAYLHDIEREPVQGEIELF